MVKGLRLGEMELVDMGYFVLGIAIEFSPAKMAMNISSL